MTAGMSLALVQRVLATRHATERLAEPLGPEDCVAQSMPDASPVKWHLAHTTWFFERFVLRPLGIEPLHDAYDYLFNSYYDTVGARHPRPKRGLLTRPTLEEVMTYRRAIDARLADLEGSSRLHEVAAALELGKNHEEQHQELILTDVKHLFGTSPLRPAYRTDGVLGTGTRVPGPLEMLPFAGGMFEMGAGPQGFAFDNERPRHKVWVAPFELGQRLVTCGEYLAFVHDRGYERPELWLSDGWQWVQSEGKSAPLHWIAGAFGSVREQDPEALEVFTLRGARAFDPHEPVCHVTYYEADAYARWAGARLPTEAEWELAVTATRDAASEHDGAFVEDDALHPRRARPASSVGLAQAMGDAWEWTSSAYSPYSGFRPLEGAFGEYNGKFMVSQLVLRGGSCATPRVHARSTYRNFFPPSAAWQFTGIRLARDA